MLVVSLIINPAFAQDADGDGIPDAEDNCPSTYNSNQENYGEDEVGNACDNCWYVSNPNQGDTFGIDCSGIIMPYTEDPRCGDVCDCIQEGETFLVGSGLTCCSDLVISSCCSPNEPIGTPDSCSCPYSCRSCTRCGDGICGTGENWCTCIEDCPKPEEIPCTENSQCGISQTFQCQQGSNVCYEYRLTCINGECSSPLEEIIYVNHSCNRYYNDPGYPSNMCVDSCTDGICHWPETRFWCSEDCDCEDLDSDYVCDWKDNCPETPNSYSGGTCSKGINAGSPCTLANENETECGTGGFCSMEQDDSDGDNIGDVCDNCTDYDNDGYGGDLSFPLNNCYGEDNCPNDYNPDQIDIDEDGAGDTCDNCPEEDNPNQEDIDKDEIGDVCDECMDTDNDGYGNPGFSSNTCDEDNCPNDYNPSQEDTYPPQGNNIGDTCDCECDFDCSGSVDASDVTSFLTDFGRNEINDPCTNGNPCNGDINCDSNVDATDVTLFLEDFGRNQFNDPCPTCEVGAWCVYP